MMDVKTSDPRIGSILNERYRIIDRIAAGGMAVVYKGERLELGRPVAIKFLQEMMLQHPKFISRFEAEAKAMSKLSHPYCVSVIDFGVEGAPYIVMDYVEGITLKALVAKERLSISRAITLARQILAGIAHAHSQGIIHRDVKPENIMLQEATGVGEQVRIFDFGLAKLMDTGPGASMTHSSLVAGTPNYMSPEQSRGKKVDERTDLYSIAVLFFELLTGRKPFIHDDFLEVVRMHRECTPPTLKDAVEDTDFSQELETLVARSLAKDPEIRYQSAEELSAALDATPEGQLAKELDAMRPDPKAKTLPVGTQSPFGENTRQDSGVTAIDASKNEPTPTPPASKTSSASFGWIALIIAAAALGMALIWWPNDEATLVTSDDADHLGNRTDVLLKTDEDKFADSTKKPPVETASKSSGPASPKETPSENEAVIAAAADSDGDDTEPLSEAEKNHSETVSNEAMPDTPPVRTIADVKALINAGNKDAAISGLQKLRREQPKRAIIVYMLANLYNEKKWLADALDHYREAIRLDKSYRKRGPLIRHLIEMMSTEKLGRKAMYLLQKNVGRPALGQLRRAAKKHKNPLVKKRAAATIKKIKGR